MHRVVIDTNVLVSGIIQKSGFPYNVVRLWERGDIVLVTSLEMIEEARRVLNYQKIKGKYGLDADDIKQTILNLLKYSAVIYNLPALNVIKEDPQDNKVMATALEGKANYIISGDSHLLNLKNYKGIEIVTAKRFCEIVSID